VAEVERWKERFLTGAENALRSRPRDEETQKEALIQRLERKVGRMALEIDIMQEAMNPYLTTDIEGYGPYCDTGRACWLTRRPSTGS